MRNIPNIRPSKELWDIINYIRAKYYLAGKKPPSINKITEVLAKKVGKEKLFHEDFYIKF